MLDKIVDFFKRIGRWFANVYYKIWAHFFVKRLEKQWKKIQSDPDRWLKSKGPVVSLYIYMYFSLAEKGDLLEAAKSMNDEIATKMNDMIEQANKEVGEKVNEAVKDLDEGADELLRNRKQAVYDTVKKTLNIEGSVSDTVNKFGDNILSKSLDFLAEILKAVTNAFLVFPTIKELGSIEKTIKTAKKLVRTGYALAEDKEGSKNIEGFAKALKSFGIDYYAPLKMFDRFMETEAMKNLEKKFSEETVKQYAADAVKRIGQTKVVSYHRAMAKFSLICKKGIDDATRRINTSSGSGAYVKSLNSMVKVWNEIVRYYNFFIKLGQKALAAGGVEVDDKAEEK